MILMNTQTGKRLERGSVSTGILPRGGSALRAARRMSPIFGNNHRSDEILISEKGRRQGVKKGSLGKEESRTKGIVVSDESRY